jgi:tetratricopeptide (TPR) repeat protein
MTRLSAAAAPTADSTADERLLTSGALAMMNLQAQIDGQERQLEAGWRATVRAQAELVELVALRGQVLGRIDDYEWCLERAERLAHDAPADSVAFLARARARVRFHRFTYALADLDEAQRLGADHAAVDGERAAIHQAIGCYETALTIYREAAQRRADFNSLGSLATLHADRGEITTAESLFEDSQARYRGVSPFPLALLEFQRGHMWLTHGDLPRARTWFEAAVRRLPAYAPAQGHLAEVEAALGDSEACIARLLPLTTSSNDPDYAATLARILKEAGRAVAALEWRNQAAKRYEDLVARYPEAFADHAAEFWLEAGADPDRALRLARMNLELRQTARAQQLFARACSRAARGRGSLPPEHR